MVALSGCAVNALREGYTPPVQAKSSPTGPVLNLSGVVVNADGVQLSNADRLVLAQSLAQVLASSGKFSRVVENGDATGDHLQADLDVSLVRTYNWWLAWPAVYPMVGYWPLQPYDAKGTLSLKAKGILSGNPFEFSTNKSIEHSETFYGFFVHSPVEVLLSQAYDQMFLELRSKVAEGSPTTSRRSGPSFVADTARKKPTRVIRNIAVMNLEPNGVDSATSKVVADQLINDFIAQGRYNVLERQKIDQILNEQGFQQSGACDNENCLVQVGKLLGVDAMVSGSVSKIQNLWIVNVRVFDVGSGVILFATQVRTEEGLSHLLSVDLKPVAEQF